ncbi:hypothetical protein LCGC14_0996570 [marine sediment metagenome]|uniref:Uncharacterized protein n=1 Tax=marine sediment metagenome TaxID=412755 RepID=A0A0F9NQT5_9ZZZZ
MEKKVIIPLIIIILIVLVAGLYFSFFYEKPITNDFPSNAICTSTYLGICYDQSNPAYGCNMETETCDNSELRLVSMIGLMQTQNIKIYGTTECPACIKQLNEFDKYGNYLIENKLFVYCDVEPIDPGCSDIEGVPTWKQNEEIVHMGYLNIQQIMSNITTSNEI